MCKNMLTFLYRPFSRRHSLAPLPSPRCYLLLKAAQRIIFLNPRRTLFFRRLFSEGGKKSTKYDAVWRPLRSSHAILVRHVGLESLIKAGKHHFTHLKQRAKRRRDHSGRERARQLPIWPAVTGHAPLAHINNTNKHKAKYQGRAPLTFMWLRMIGFLLHHARGITAALEGYQSVRSAALYNCECSLSALPATTVDISHTALCDGPLTPWRGAAVGMFAYVCRTYINEF